MSGKWYFSKLTYRTIRDAEPGPETRRSTETDKNSEVGGKETIYQDAFLGWQTVADTLRLLKNLNRTSKHLENIFGEARTLFDNRFLGVCPPPPHLTVYYFDIRWRSKTNPATLASITVIADFFAKRYRPNNNYGGKKRRVTRFSCSTRNIILLTRGYVWNAASFRNDYGRLRRRLASIIVRRVIIVIYLRGLVQQNERAIKTRRYRKIITLHVRTTNATGYLFKTTNCRRRRRRRIIIITTTTITRFLVFVLLSECNAINSFLSLIIIFIRVC